MILTTAILNEARSWIGCKETSKNRSECVDEIQKLYNGKVNSEAWCAKFVWAITNVACGKLRVPNPLKQTASTITMKNEAKKTLRVDKLPGVGSVFFNVRDGGGHVGFVQKIDGNYFHTIEGNTNVSGSADGVWEKKHNLNDTAKNTNLYI